MSPQLKHGRLALLLGLAVASLTTVAVTVSTSSNDSAAEVGTHTVTGASLLGRGGHEDLLKWALAHSDPEELKRAAAAGRAGAEWGTAKFLERRHRVQQLLETMKAEPTEEELMMEAVAILSSPASMTQHLGNALEGLRYLVEPIDAANNLQGMGGLAPVVALLDRQQPPMLQAKAAHLLGTAASNNPEFQRQLLGDHPEVLPLLLQLLGTDSSGSKDGSSSSGGGDNDPHAAAVAEAGIKALYCLSAILRLDSAARGAFYQAAGMQTLHLSLRSGGAGARLQRNVLSLLTDLIGLDAMVAGAQQQQQTLKPAMGLDYLAAVATVLQVLDAGRAADLDIQEKALLALEALLASPAAPTAAQMLAATGGGAILAQLQSSLQAAAAADEDGGYLLELAVLAARVQGRAAAAGGRVEAGGTHDTTEL